MTRAWSRIRRRDRITGRLPEEIDRTLRIDGHTDRWPISTYEIASNPAFSTARAF